MNGIGQALRLVIHALPPAVVRCQRKKRARSLESRGMLRDRWQSEIDFKRQKTLGHLDDWPSMDLVLARTWLLSPLIAAVLIENLAIEIVVPPVLRRTDR